MCPASLNPGMQDDHILLGMSVLLRFTQRRLTLELRAAGKPLRVFWKKAWRSWLAVISMRLSVGSSTKTRYLW